jgi:ribosomal-protein-alanine N-acetyltransferase
MRAYRRGRRRDEVLRRAAFAHPSRMTEPSFSTQRLDLRPLAPTDHARLAAIFRDPYVRRYLWDARIPADAEVSDVIAGSEASFRAHGFGLWCVAERGARGETIGVAGVRPTPEGELELIYAFLPEHWGRGFALEAARAVMARAFARDPGRARLLAVTDLENKASVRVMLRLGLRFAKAERVNGMPLVVYEIAREDFRA